MAKNILIIDDSSMMRLALQSALSEANYDVTEAVDGMDGLKKLLSKEKKIDLIICDVNMPNLDGIGFVKAYKKHEEFTYIPVLMLTTEGSEAKKMEGKAAGVKAWMLKPFDKNMLLGAVAKLIS